MGGSGSSLRSGAGAPNANASPTSTRGRIVEQGGGQWWAENDNGYAVAILGGDSSDINLFRYGSRRIYEVIEYDPSGRQVGATKYVSTKAEADRITREYLRAHQ